MEEAVSNFQSVVEVEQQNLCTSDKITPWKKILIPPEGQTKNRGWIKPPKYGKELKAIP